MKQITKPLLILFSVSIIFIGGYYIYTALTTKKVKEEDKAFIVDQAFINLLEPGDILLKQGKGRVSKMIIEYLKEDQPFSHCGIIYKNTENDTPFIIHSVAKELSGRDGVQTISLQDFINDTRAGTLWVVRKKTDIKKRIELAEKANHFLQNKVTFDYDFDHLDSNKIYCTELAFLCLNHIDSLIKFNTVTREEKTVLAFKSLIDTAMFEIIVK
jgi:hypothetical protein